MVEYWSPKPGVAGSSPVSPASLIRRLNMQGAFVFIWRHVESMRPVPMLPFFVSFL